MHILETNIIDATYTQYIYIHRYINIYIYTSLCLPDAHFFVFAWNSIYFVVARNKNVAVSHECSCSKWSRIAMTKGNQQICCMWQWCHIWSIGNQVDWHGLGGLWSFELRPFVSFDCHLDTNRTTKTIQNWGTGKKTLLYREETLLSRGETPLYWFRAPSPKLFCHQGPSTQSCCDSTFALKKKAVRQRRHSFPVENRERFACPCTMGQCSKNEPWMWMTKIFKHDQ